MSDINILIEKDPANIVPKTCSFEEAQTYARDFVVHVVTDANVKVRFEEYVHVLDGAVAEEPADDQPLEVEVVAEPEPGAPVVTEDATVVEDPVADAE